MIGVLQGDTRSLDYGSDQSQGGLGGAKQPMMGARVQNTHKHVTHLSADPFGRRSKTLGFLLGVYL